MIEKLISSFLVFLVSLGVGVSKPTTYNLPRRQAGSQPTTIFFAGDVMLGRSVMGVAIDDGDYFFPFRKTADLLKDADITFVNLENPIISDCPSTSSGFTFCTTFEIAQGLKFAGIDIITLANNHSSNFGEEGLEESKKYLSDLGIAYTGVGDLIIKKVNGTKFGFLGFDYVFKDLRDEDIKLIQDSDKLVDVLIVSPHWGDEYTSYANNFQIQTAKKFVENGADLIVGHHPHWVQNSEVIDGIPVYYSLGNFVFDQMWSENTKKGKLVKFTFEGNKIIKTEEFNSYLKKIGQPEIVKP